jgi:hypothetical protein
MSTVSRMQDLVNKPMDPSDTLLHLCSPCLLRVQVRFKKIGIGSLKLLQGYNLKD